MQCSCKCEKRLFLQLGNKFSEAEISQLHLFVLDEDVGGFDVSMKNPFFFEIGTTRNELLGEPNNLRIVYFDFVLLNILM